MTNRSRLRSKPLKILRKPLRSNRESPSFTADVAIIQVPLNDGVALLHAD